MITRRLFSTEITPLTRIGRALIRIPEEYKTFFNTKQPETPDIYDPNMKLLVHLEGDPEKVLEIAGRQEVFSILERMKVLMKWGHFYWRLSDLSGLNLDTIRVIRPSVEIANKSGSVEMKVYWQLKVRRNGAVFIDGKDTKMTLKSLLQVQLHRLQLLNSEPASKPHDTILYTGISRYVFDTQNGYCTELHVERVEPKIRGIDWKWKMSKVKFSEA